MARLRQCDRTAAWQQRRLPRAVRLHRSPRSLSVQLGLLDGGPLLGTGRAQAMSLNVIGKTAVAPDLGVYGRLGTFVGRSSGPAVTAVSLSEGSGVSYGMGFSWELSPRASASLGVDTYDFRTATGDSRDVRATSLGLQWRY
jgi:OmpA-OmpF porin, OOP family